MSELFRLQIDHIEVAVPSRFEAADWYRRTLGMHILEQHLEWASDPDGPLMIGFAHGGPMLALYQGAGYSGKKRVGLFGIAFATDGAGFLAFLESLLQNPVYDEAHVLTTEPQIVDYGEEISAYFCDPYGTPLEVTTYETELVRARLGMHRERADL
jgi:catechol 2,3-dioxygenase-like lactoylglutathione lyase family enzyme